VTPYELIKRKRDGLALDPADIARFIQGFTDGSIPEYQMSAMCMAIFFRSLAPPELAAWTEAMLHSGEVLDLSETPGIKVDKHSTGGVGDKISLCLAPMVAACGVPVPMISGRGLGHTGGTLDKLESIPGFKVNLSIAEYRKMVREVGACLIGQTATLAPADKKLYALRDVTATVDCIPLIASSIMSKKMAEGIDALVLDVKVGSGAFMKTVENARVLARTMIDIGQRMGKQVTALITDMDQPLGRAIGNALEVEEAIAVLHGKAPADVTELNYALCSEMLVLGKKAQTTAEARQQLEEVVRTGAALKKLQEIVTRQGGDAEAVVQLDKLPRARQKSEVLAPRDGFVGSIQTEGVGLAAVALGAGRERVDSPVDPAVGFTLEAKVGHPVKKGQPLVTVHHNGGPRVAEVCDRLLAAYSVVDAPPSRLPLILERVA